MASELEERYKTALETISGGVSWETLLASEALEKKSRTPGREVLSFLGNNLAAIASLVVAISGISFGIVQYLHSSSQSKNETKIARVQAIQKLIPPLTNENPDVRRYALAALLALYPDQEGSPEAETKELQSLGKSIANVSDAETLEAFGRRLNDPSLMKRAAEIYTSRAKAQRYEAASKQDEAANENEGEAKSRIEKEATARYKAAWDDIQKAVALDPKNANALYENGRLLMDYRGDNNSALLKFEQVIKLIEQNESPKDQDIYLGSYLNRTRLVRTNPPLCDYYTKAKAKYQEMQIPLNVQDEKLEEIEKQCSPK